MAFVYKKREPGTKVCQLKKDPNVESFGSFHYEGEGRFHVCRCF